MPRSIDLMIAGVQKAATTSLLHYLGQHPQIVGHDTREFPYFIRDALYERDFASFCQNYYPEQIREDQILLAKSVGISYSSEAARRLRRHSPSCEIIIMLRDPVERAYSAYWYMRRMGWETKDTFEAALEVESSRREEGGTVAENCSYRARGKYDEQISRMRRLFGEGNVHVLLMNDLKENPVQTCRFVFEAIGVNPSFQPDVSKRNTAKAARLEGVSQAIASVKSADHVLKDLLRSVVPTSLARRARRALQRWNETNFTPPPMKESTRKALAEYFEPHNKRLEDLIDRSLSHWTRV